MKQEYILSIHSSIHDSAVAIFKDCNIIAAISKERLTRKKGDNGYPNQCIDEVLHIAGIGRHQIDTIVLTRAFFPARYLQLPIKRFILWHLQGTFKKRFRYIFEFAHKTHESLKLRGCTELNKGVFKKKYFLKENKFPEKTKIFFSNHHLTHILPAIFYTMWDNVLLYTADGIGDNVSYSMRIFKNNEISCLYGSDANLFSPTSIDSLGFAYTFATGALGFTPCRHEGKVTGLAAYGKPTVYDDIIRHFTVLESGRIVSDFSDYDKMKHFICNLANKTPKEDLAASIQKALEDCICRSIQNIIKQHGVEQLVLSGGVFSNVRLNQQLYEKTDIKEIFIYPAMGDEGLVVGGALQYLLHRDGLATLLSQRRRLTNMYLGRDYDQSIDKILVDHPSVKKTCGDIAKLAATQLAGNKIGAIYTGRMEFGPRALGARSIIANPSNNALNDTLNKRLNRTEFMPFAPYVLEEDACDVFDITDGNRYACEFMTITVKVKEKWRDKMPAVVHIDNTARPQVITKEVNPLYYSILKSFKKNTGIPVLVNTSFNAHEEPIINKPEECLHALLNKRIDFVITKNGIYHCD